MTRAMITSTTAGGRSLLPAPPAGAVILPGGLEQLTRATKRRGRIVILLFLLLAILPAAVVPLASAALAPGVVSPEGSRRIVQHLEGGIIHDILVRDGDKVEAGQPLMTLEDVQARAQHDVLHDRLLELLAREARLQAEQLGHAAIDLPPEIAEAASEPAVQRLMSIQQGLFATRRAAREGREGALRRQVDQLDEESAGLRALTSSQQEELRLMGEQVEGVRKLAKAGLTPRHKLLALERQRTEIEGSIATNKAAIARNRQAVAEIELRVLTAHDEAGEEIGQELAQLRNDLEEVRARLPMFADTLARTTVTAPEAGTVVELRFTTKSGVVHAGEPILDLVPLNADLLIEARVRPDDIDVVHQGQEATIILTPYRRRHLPELIGRVRDVSADRIQDEQGGQPYFLARIEVDKTSLENLGLDVHLLPGMPAEVMILIGERTLLSYLLDPLTRTLRHSLRES